MRRRHARVCFHAAGRRRPELVVAMDQQDNTHQAPPRHPHLLLDTHLLSHTPQTSHHDALTYKSSPPRYVCGHTTCTRVKAQPAIQRHFTHLILTLHPPIQSQPPVAIFPNARLPTTTTPEHPTRRSADGEGARRSSPTQWSSVAGVKPP
ncbi:hypothetical protein BDV95DRAFT_51014 [Massariosphaeria phaeospora]|uniref:Uncharacterized protein n=1 Tax=Massariosphaeria phaeospora TaxID=100035 RepID=A0A7C8M7N8_9PLEO|nr:hypothetical protein BDV95DRAFT_51014 [Massariosphaeria phaeospora]